MPCVTLPTHRLLMSLYRFPLLSPPAPPPTSLPLLSLWAQVNHAERTYSVFVALIGVVTFAFAMGNITTLMGTTQGARLRFDDKLRTVSEYLFFRDVDATLKRRILTHFGINPKP